jgi:hypothetical protein
MKTAIQMLIGVGAILFLCVMLWESGRWQFPDDKLVLELIAKALALAAAVELAYTLFTDGPDEAIDPPVSRSIASIGESARVPLS